MPCAAGGFGFWPDPAFCLPFRVNQELGPPCACRRLGQPPSNTRPHACPPALSGRSGCLPSPQGYQLHGQHLRWLMCLWAAAWGSELNKLLVLNSASPKATLHPALSGQFLLTSLLCALPATVNNNTVASSSLHPAWPTLLPDTVWWLHNYLFPCPFCPRDLPPYTNTALLGHCKLPGD